jgi:hypothetical protein
VRRCQRARGVGVDIGQGGPCLERVQDADPSRKFETQRLWPGMNGTRTDVKDSSRTIGRVTCSPTNYRYALALPFPARAHWGTSNVAQHTFNQLFWPFLARLKIPAAPHTEPTLYVFVVCDLGNMRGGDILASIQLLLCRKWNTCEPLQGKS